MATKKHPAQIGALIAEVEALAKRIRTDLRKQAAALPKDMKAMAARLRKQAAQAAAQVEKYVHELRMELERGAPKKVRKVARVRKTR